MASAIVTSSAYAQSTASSGADAGDHAFGSLDEVVVTGVRGQPRTAADSPTPIDTLSADELANTGRPGIVAALQYLVPSIDVPFRSGGGSNYIIASGGLRTLNPDQTLVLVNGTRRHSTPLINVGNQLFSGAAPVDLDLIATSSISRIEVLRDGAAAQYGSDAVAGVINIILKDTPGGYVNTSYGENFDRNDGQLYQAAGTFGTKFWDAGSLNLSFGWKKQKRSNRAVPVPDSQQLYPLINGQRDPREATANRLVTYNYGNQPIEGVNFADNVKYQLGDVELYTFGTLSQRKSNVLYTWQFANSVNTLPQIYPNGFAALREWSELDFQQAAGVRGELSSWHWDLSSTVGQDRVRDSVSNSLNPTLGPTSPTDFYLGTLTSGQWVTSLDVSRNFDVKGVGSVQVSFGAQDRVEWYKIHDGDVASYVAGSYVIPAGQPFAGQRPTPGAVQTPGYRPENAGSWKRNILAAYSEVDIEPTDDLFLGAALRFESYDDSSGDSVVGQLNGRYDLTDWLAVRGSVGTGFHAPSIAQQHYSNNASQFATTGTFQILQTVLAAPDQTVAKLLGATPLKPEKSRNFSAGVTLQPTARMNVTIDAYQIDLDDRIFQSGLISGAAVNSVLVANGLPSGQSVSYFTNGANTRTRGLDVVLSDVEDLGDYGRLRLSVAYGYNETKLKSVIANPPALNILGPSYILLDAASRGYLTEVIPNHKATVGVNWSLGRFEANVRETWNGPWRIINNNPALTGNYRGSYTTDFEGTYHVTDAVTVAVGANNLFNRYPDRNVLTQPTLGTSFYPQQSPIGFTGGSWYARVQMNF